MTVTRFPVGSTCATVQAPNFCPASMALMAATVPVAAVDGLIRVNAGQRLNIMAMIRMATAEAFEAIAATLALGTVGYETEANERGERFVWLAPNAVNRLRAMRGPGESYSDVILRLAAERA